MTLECWTTSCPRWSSPRSRRTRSGQSWRQTSRSQARRKRP